MHFKDKAFQDVLEVLIYDQGPKCYGFYQQKYFLAYLIEENQGWENWLMTELSENDLSQYEALKSDKISLKSFLTSRPSLLTRFSPKGLQVSEKPLILDEPTLSQLAIS